MKTALFFDIDGTIWDFHNYIPESTKDAIRQLRANGHLTFLCSGRTRAFIQNPELLGLGFDGIISGCGTMVEYGNNILFYKELEKELAIHTLETVRRFGFRPILEGRKYLYMDKAEFEGDAYGNKIKADLGAQLRTIADYWGQWEISKLSCATEHTDREGCFAALSEYYDYIIHNAAVVEMVPKGFHKGTGIQKICEMLGLEASDTYAFGDSVNDLGMFQAAGTAVAMGNGQPTAIEAADYVTAALAEDGIWKACRHFGLI